MTLHWAIVLLLGCLGAVGQAASSPATIPLATYVGALRSVTVTIAGSPHPFIFDTGGGETMISPALASKIGCTPYGRAVGFRASGEQVTFQYCDDVTLRIGGVAIAHERVGVFDLQSILPAGLPQADGVVSLRSFRDRSVTIDFGKQTLTIESPATLPKRTSVMRPLRIRIATGPTGAETTVYVAARIAGQRSWLLLDSGNGDPLLLAEHLASAAGREGREGEVVVALDGLEPLRLPARSSRIIYDGVLGARFMDDWLLTLDLERGRAWIAAGPPRTRIKAPPPHEWRVYAESVAARAPRGSRRVAAHRVPATQPARRSFSEGGPPASPPQY